MNKTQISKTLTYYLRHHPEKLGITLDKEGFVSVALLLEKLAETGLHLDDKVLLEISRDDSKGRYTMGEGKIRANQGHSTDQVDLNFQPRRPSVPLYHGTTYERFMKIQISEQLSPMGRQYVHLTSSIETAKSVSERWRGETPVILKVNTYGMDQNGHIFYISDNNVWLTDFVPLEYLSIFKPIPYRKDFSVDEKVAIFDSLHTLAVDYLNIRLAEGEAGVEDYPEWFMEDVLKGCLGEKIFQYLNKLKS